LQRILLATAIGILAVGPSARASRPGADGQGDAGGRGWWRFGVSIGTVVSFVGWDASEVEARGGTAGAGVTRDYSGGSGFSGGAYFAAYAGLDRHFQLGGFVSYAGLGMSAARADSGAAFYRALNVVGLGLSVKGGGRVHRVVWLGAALDAGLSIVLPRNLALSEHGGGLELDDWYGMFLFPRLHVDIVASGRGDAGVGFFADLGPMLVPYSEGSGRSRISGTELGFSSWAACLQLVLGFSLGA
jgi:hypothetical protein